ncbi:phage replisome organizer N-terminal domain-containing protein [Domibacillus aminovorans]|uniref:phage replisome organizer N-terminal domain-containing protein n=1 Tax=Domibacillus aminovorans TaxID=29332 RepID=UPI0007C6A67A|nr:phage replisome organizer N-terminal domain-containing protein [Domibacillus aminovorans]
MSDVKWIKLSTHMFEDEKIRLIESMPEADTILIIWVKLLSQAGKTNASGYIYLSENIPYTEEMLATIFNRPLNIVRMALETFKGFGMIEIADDHMINIANWEKHQNVEGMDKIREQNRIRKQKQREKQKELPMSRDGHGTVMQGHATDIDKDIDIDIDIEKKKNNSRKQAYDESSVYYQLANRLYQKILDNNPNHKQPDLQKWANDVRLMMERDDRTDEQILFLIDWTQEHDFWQANILSIAKLREKYDQLVLQVKSERAAAEKAGKRRGSGVSREEKLPGWFEQKESIDLSEGEDAEFLRERAAMEAELRARDAAKEKREVLD